MSDAPLQVFVAMPGTTMGPNASYSKPESVKANLLQPAIEKLKARLDRDVKLSIEKDKRIAGVIHESMFAEARDADVYVADLTGANPNVYLELGVRWALRDKVTVIICQSVEDLKFNVFANRAILYQPDYIIKAIDDLVDAILAGLDNAKSDSPVRLNSEYVVVRKPEMDALRADLDRLTRARGEDLLRAALGADDVRERLRLLEQARDANPASPEVLLELGMACRNVERYAEAVDVFKQALRLAPSMAILHRELGVTYSKSGQPEKAAESLKEAVRLSPEDAEAWSNLGGALRRIGVAHAPAEFDREALIRSRESYATANKLDKRDLYSALNVCRLDLLLSKWDAQKSEAAKRGFEKHEPLAHFEVQDEPQNYWRRFDWADTLLFSGETGRALEEFERAAALVPLDERPDKLKSVLGPLEGYVAAGAVTGALRKNVEKVIERLHALVKKARPASR